MDLDLPAGSLNQSMRLLREKVGGFDYQILPHVLYVRSNLLIDQKTSIDAPLLEGGRFEGDLAGLAKMIMAHHPSSYIDVQYVQGHPAGGIVKLEIPDKSSVKDALIQYAAASKYGWVMRRAGHLTHDADGKPAIFGTGIEPRGPRTGVSRLPAVYNRLSGAAALANASKRLDTPLVVYDRSVLQDVRGIMNLALQNDPILPLDDTLNNLSQSGFGPGSWHFHWRDVDGVPVLMTNHFLYYLRGRDILGKTLLPGEFNGSLPELARWINSHVKDPNGEVLMGGEIVDGQPRAVKAEVTTVAQAIEQFAKTSRSSPYVIILDLQNPFTGVRRSPAPGAGRTFRISRSGGAAGRPRRRRDPRRDGTSSESLLEHADDVPDDEQVGQPPRTSPSWRFFARSRRRSARVGREELEHVHAHVLREHRVDVREEVVEHLGELDAILVRSFAPPRREP